MKKLTFFVVLAILAMATLLVSAETPNLTLPAAFTTKAPVIDGLLNDAAWLTASQWGAKGVLDIDNIGTSLGNFPRVVYLAYDEQNLYIGFIIPTKDANALTTTADAFWNTDEVEVVLQYPETGAYYKVTVVANGELYEDQGTGVAYAAVSKTATTWSAEIVMPFSTIESTPRAGDTWRIGIFSHQITDGSRWYTWNPTYGKFNNQARFGELLFLGN